MAERRLLADLTPLRESPHYRRLTIGTALSGIGSTMATLLVLPTVFVIVQKKASASSPSLDPDDRQSPHFTPPQGG